MLDDSCARQEWSWNPEYDLPIMVEDMLEKLSENLAALQVTMHLLSKPVLLKYYKAAGNVSRQACSKGGYIDVIIKTHPHKQEGKRRYVCVFRGRAFPEHIYNKLHTKTRRRLMKFCLKGKKE